MKQILQKGIMVVLTMMTGFTVFAQTGAISGKAIDDETNEPLVGANVVIQGTTKGSVTDVDGNFRIEEVETGTQNLIISFIGYEEQRLSVKVREDVVTDVGTIDLASSAVGLQEVQVIASIAIDRRTPVAASTIRGEDIETRVGNQEFPEILRHTPSVYVTKSGGGFGDSRINVRGFDQRNTAVMINGVPVNDMENGWVYWSNWAGLTDVASTVQVQRGLGASKLAVASVGGSINIITDAAKMKQGGSASLDIGNDNYMKYGASYSTGLSENGFALTLSYSRTQGNGYADGTLFRANSYFLSMVKQFNSSHALHFTVLGAPQWHHQREYGSFDGVTIATIEERGIKYNPQWGTYGESDLKDNEFSWRKNFYHKPKAFVNHYWTISDQTQLATSAYASIGRGGGTGDLGRINGDFRTDSKFFNDAGQVRWDDIQRWNSGGSVPDFGDDQDPWAGPGSNFPIYIGPYAGENVAESRRNGLIRRASMNEHNWYGVLSNLTHEINSNLTFTGGLDARYYKGLHYRRVENLLGLDAYYDDDDINQPDKYITDEGREDGNQIDYNNDGYVNWLGLFSQVEYSVNDLSVFLSLSGSNQGFKRVDYFLYEDDDPMQESSWENFLGGTAKAGANYNINSQHNVFVNGGYFSRQPIFDNVFLNFSNEVNTDVQNQSVMALEAGYGFRSSALRANLNVYHTLWGDRQLSRGDRQVVNDPVDGPIQVDGTTNFEGIEQLHQGIELDLTYSPVTNFSINGMASLNNWRYTDEFSARWVPEDVEYKNQARDITLFMDDVKVADAAQTTLGFGVEYNLKGLSLYGNYFYADDLYADFDLSRDDSFLTPGSQAWQLPKYDLVDLGLRYKFKVFGVDATFKLNVNNVFDERYIAESETNILYDADDPSDVEYGENGSIRNIAYFGFGTTWNTGLKVNF